MTSKSTATPVVLPIIHINGSTAQSLLNDLGEVQFNLHNAMAALLKNCPHKRNYYLKDGLFEEAMRQHEHRLTVLRGVLDSLRNEAEGIANMEEARRTV